MQVKLFAQFSLLVFPLFPATSLFSQQIAIGTPFNSINDGYYERYGIGWGLNWRGGYASFGLPNQAIPPFGKFDPSSGLQTAWRFGNGNFYGGIYLSAGQGFYGSYTSQMPFVTSMNGYPGAFYEQSLSPFVAGYTPVVDGYPTFYPMMRGIVPQNNYAQPNPLDRVQVMRRILASQNAVNMPGTVEPDPGEAMLPRHSSPVVGGARPMTTTQGSSADRPVPSVAEAKRLYELEKNAANKEVLALFERAIAAEEEGKLNLAKIYYQMVVRRAQGDLKQTAQRLLKTLNAEIIAQKLKSNDEIPINGKEF